MPDTREITTIQVGIRHRKHLGDLHVLAESMATVGLLHPVVITPDNRLVAGARRLAAAQALGWHDIPVRVIDLPSLLQAEHDENVLREPFLPTEAVAIGRALEEEIAAANAVKQREAASTGGKTGGRGRSKSADSLTTNNGKAMPSDRHARTTTSKVGKAVGMGGTTYTKAKAVVLAAEAEPERYGDLVQHMDETGSVDKAYQTMQRRHVSDVLPGKSPQQLAHEDPARRWTDSLRKLGILMRSVEEYAEGITNLTQHWKPALRQQYLDELYHIQRVMQTWIKALEERPRE